jgi:hypothetical protein
LALYAVAILSGLLWYSPAFFLLAIAATWGIAISAAACVFIQVAAFIRGWNLKHG